VNFCKGARGSQLQTDEAKPSHGGVKRCLWDSALMVLTLTAGTLCERRFRNRGFEGWLDSEKPEFAR
jgi:hypothetical protein